LRGEIYRICRPIINERRRKPRSQVPSVPCDIPYPVTRNFVYMLISLVIVGFRCRVQLLRERKRS